MGKLKNLSGQDVIKILAIFDFYIESQKGSHVNRLSIRYISGDDLRKYFYND